MPITYLDLPILSRFLCAVESTTGEPPKVMTESMAPSSQQSARSSSGSSSDKSEDEPRPPLPKGVVLGPDGKPCRTCTSASSWKAMMSRASTSSTSPSPPATTETSSDCPPDVELLGRSTWTLLHTLTAQYPERATPAHQTTTRQFLSSFGKLYPCWVCAEDFRAWMEDARNAPRVGGREEFGRWMCEAHNAVNAKLGKKEFDCDFWEERWRTGWRDGRCG